MAHERLEPRAPEAQLRERPSRRTSKVFFNEGAVRASRGTHFSRRAFSLRGVPVEVRFASRPRLAENKTPPRSLGRGSILDRSSDRSSKTLGPSWIRDRKISDPRSEDLGPSTRGSIEDRASSSRSSSSSIPSSRLDPRWILGSRIQNPRAVVDSRSPKISDPRSEDLGSSTLGSIEEST